MPDADRPSLELKVFLPIRKMVETRATSVLAEDPTGQFGIRPGHEPFLTPLVAGLLAYTEPGGPEHWLAVDEGLLVTDGALVEVYTRDVHVSDSPEDVHRVVTQKFATRRAAELDRRNAMLKMQLAAFKMLFGYER